MLIECKLWRNHEARRQVVAQILEYAALLQQLTYPDLSARLVRRLGFAGPNPLWAAACRHLPGLPEVPFVEAMSRCLSTGDFDLIIAGDGIRADLHAIAEYIHGRNRTIARSGR